MKINYYKNGQRITEDIQRSKPQAKKGSTTAQKSYYKRKTIERWKFHAQSLVLLVVTFSLLTSMIQNKLILNENINLVTQVQAQKEKEISIAEQVGFARYFRLEEKEVIKYDTPETIEEKIRAVFVEDPDTAVKVAKCESGLRPDAKSNISSARGLFQVLSYLHGVNERFLYNPDVNIQIAHQLYTESNGWGPWEASRHCWDK